MVMVTVTVTVPCRLISRADFLSAIEKYIDNLPDDLKPDPDEDDLSGSNQGDDESSSEVSLGLKGDDNSDGDDSDGDDDRTRSDDEVDDENVVIPEGFVHTPLTSGDATNYPVAGDSCEVHWEGKVARIEADGPAAELVVFESTYVGWLVGWLVVLELATTC